MSRKKPAAVVEDAEFLAQSGESLPSAATRLGYSHPDSLKRTLNRAGRADVIDALRVNTPETPRAPLPVINDGWGPTFWRPAHLYREAR